MRGLLSPLTPDQKGAHSLSLMYLFDRSGEEKVITFLTTFIKQNQVLTAKIRHFCHLLRLQKGWV
jgi:hypothetical protein